ncbi:hypothetical protein C8Q73DRAFT_180872 [Cubamyces lactineus]|nr:hypothetical protein C8Q73DRAFT_180872 [Cubamyces lactineus]
MSDLGFNVWGTIAAVLGTMTLPSVFIAWFTTRLPRARLPDLSNLLLETLLLFLTGLREGLYNDDSELRYFDTHIQNARCAVEDVRAEVFGITTWRQDVKHWYTGLSGNISDISEDLISLRASLAKIQSGKRKLLAAQGYPSKRALSPYAQELLRKYAEILLLPYSSTCASLAPSEGYPSEGPAALSAVSSSVGVPVSTPLTKSDIGLSAPSDAGSSSPTPSLAPTSSLLSGDSEQRHTISDADLKVLLCIILLLLCSNSSQAVERSLSEATQGASPQCVPKPAPTRALLGSGGRLPLRLAKRTGIKASLLYRPIVRRSLSTMGVASAAPQPDPESLVSPGCGRGDKELQG